VGGQPKTPIAASIVYGYNPVQNREAIVKPNPLELSQDQPYLVFKIGIGIPELI
jgi:hypothetical protein